MECLGMLPKKKRKEMQQFFAGCPEAVRETVQVLEIPEGTAFMQAGESSRYIYLVLKGTVRGLEMHMQEKVYIFKQFSEGKILGELECFLGLDKYRATIETTDDCVVAAIPSKEYYAWMRQDNQALFMRTQSLVRDFVDEVSVEREYHFLSCMDRLVLFLLDTYEQTRNDGSLRITQNRDEISDTIGFCVKTLNRNIKALEEKGFLSMSTGKILLTKEHYEKMEAYAKKQMIRAEKKEN